MKLLVVRHAIAETREEFARTGKHDDLRPITPRGRRRMHRATGALRILAPEVGLLAASPLVRAAQTTDVLAEAYPEAVREVAEALAPDHDLPAALQWLRLRTQYPVVAAVGHEPHLSHLVSWLLGGRFTSFVQLKKGAACLLDFAGEPAPGEARLLWLLQPEQLRRLARRR